MSFSNVNPELEFEANQLRDIVLFELRTAVGDKRRNLMKARNLLWIIGTEINKSDESSVNELWSKWQRAVNLTCHVILDLYLK
jgi:hypothetical protein